MTRAAPIVLAALLAAPPARAQTEPAGDGAVTLDVQAAELVDAEALREALEADLGVEVRLVHDPAARVVISASDDGRITLRVRRAGGDVLEREAVPEEGGARTITTVTLLVANLVRDESSELLALLRIARAPETVEPAPEPVEPAPAPPPPPVPAAPAVPVPEPTPDAEPSLDPMPAAIDFAPLLGFSTATQGRDRRHFALGVVGALSGRVEGLSLSGVVDLTLGEVRGLQLAGVAALAGGPVHGAQLGLVGVTTDRVAGLQLTWAVAIAPNGLEGLQMSLVGVAGPVRGVQMGLVDVASSTVEGMQLGLVNVAAGEVRGAQLGLTNVAGGSLDGSQIGLVNVASGRVRGLQLGLVNVAESAGAAIGLVSVQHAGRTQLRVGADTNGYLGATLVHGAGVGRWLLHAAGNPFLASRPGALVGVGFGFRIEPVDILHVDVELVTSAVLDRTLGHRGPDLLGDARLLFGVRIVEGLGIYAALGYRLHYTGDRRDDVELGAPFGVSELVSDSTDLLRGWPALHAGVELF